MSHIKTQNELNYSPLELVDNKTLNDAYQNWEEHMARIKNSEAKLRIVKAAFIDLFGEQKQSALSALKEDYADEQDFNEEALPVYLKVCDLIEAMTPRQVQIAYDFLVNEMTVTEIAAAYKISLPGVLKSLSLIKKKAKKLGVKI